MVIMKRLTATLAAGATSLTFTDAAMNSNSIIEIYAVDMDVYPINQQQTGEHSVTVTFDAQMDAVNVVCLINNVMSLSQPEAASNVTYDNTESGLEAENVQTAIDELSQPEEASNVSYDNTDSGLSATDVQGAIDELAQSGGGGNTYSETEQAVGTWIDGKTIYRKVVKYTGTFYGDQSVSLDTGLTNVDQILPTTCINGIHSANTPIPLPYTHYIANNNIGYFISADFSKLNLRMGSAYTSGTYIKQVNAVYEYTKTV